MKLVLTYLRKPHIAALQLLSLSLLMLANGLNVLVPRMTGDLVNYTLQTNQPDVTQRNQIAIVIGVSFIITFFQLILASFISERVGFIIRRDLIQKVTAQTYGYIRKTTPGRILTNMTSDIVNIKNFLANGINLIIVSLLLIIGSFLLMLSLNVKLTLVILPLLPAILIIFGLIFGRAQKLFRSSQKVRDKLNQLIDENIKASMLIRVLASETKEEERFGKVNQRARRLGEKIVNVFSLLVPIINLVNYVAIVLLLAIGGQEIAAGNLNTGDLLAFYQYITMFIGPIIVLGFIGTSISQMTVSAGRITNILHSRVEFHNGDMPIERFESLQLLKAGLELEEEDGTSTILHDINLTVKRGQKIGVVGETGSGKSMLLQLIPRFLEISQGRILLNSKDIKDFDIDLWRHKVGFVLQDNFVFNSTIRDNILLGRTEVSEEEFMRVSQIAEVDEFVQQFPDKYETVIGERGTTLSGGQKQRITLARALISKPELIMLDDSTSKLDIETELRIFDNLRKEYPELSMIIVSQKIASVRDCDQIYVLDQGELESQGTHNELKDKSYIYKELELSQSNRT